MGGTIKDSKKKRKEPARAGRGYILGKGVSPNSYFRSKRVFLLTKSGSDLIRSAKSNKHRKDPGGLIRGVLGWCV